MQIALAQINNTIGDLDANANKILEYAKRAADGGADLVAFPELALTGYPPRDLVEKDSFLERTREALDRIIAASVDLDIALIVGYVGRTPKQSILKATNAAAVIDRGQLLQIQTKILLPTYDVFDEARYFAPGDRQHIVTVRGVRVGLAICEDFWNDKQFWERLRYDCNPIEDLVAQGAEVLLSINASPWNVGKRLQRQEIFKALARRFALPAVYVHMVGGNDQLVFDGSSFAMTAAGELTACARSFAEDMVLFDTKSGRGERHDEKLSSDEAAYEALVLGTRDYIRKCGFSRALLGLSGGIDSALVAAIAVEAVGKENVLGVGMPGPYSSEHSLTDARALACGLGVRFEVIPIKAGYEAMVDTLEPVFAGLAPDTTEENLQSRLRGVTVMALSNKFGALVMTTGNKSEIAVGYCTLYGDMCGGLAVISDVPKTMVYRLARIANERWRKRGLASPIPESTFTKPPSAELRPDQKDTDSLPDYEVLDAILASYVEQYKSVAQIVAEQGFPIALVRDIVRLVDRNEYKRQQAAPGLRITPKAFGVGRRFPIAHRFRE